jgi:uncharacterized membrane protein
MVQYIPMIILMGLFAVVGLFWAIGTRQFISWARKYQGSFNHRPGEPVETSAVKAGVQSSAMLTWGVRLTGIALAAVGVIAIWRIIAGI